MRLDESRWQMNVAQNGSENTHFTCYLCLLHIEFHLPFRSAAALLTGATEETHSSPLLSSKPEITWSHLGPVTLYKAWVIFYWLWGNILSPNTQCLSPCTQPHTQQKLMKYCKICTVMGIIFSKNTVNLTWPLHTFMFRSVAQAAGAGGVSDASD